MGDFCGHFGVLAAPPRSPMDASLGQEPSKLDQNVRQMDRFGEKGAPGQNISIYYVLKLSGWALERTGRLKDAPGGLIGGKGPPCAGTRAQGFNWDLWKRSQTSGNGRERTGIFSNPGRIRGQSLSKGQDI